MEAGPGAAPTGELLTEEQWRERRRQRWMERRHRRFPVFAIFAVVAGIGWLGHTMGWWQVRFEWDYVGPVLLIIFGLSALSRWTMRRGG